MSRFLAETRHVNPHQSCTATAKSGNGCEAMTNQVCVKCNRGLCGRHVVNHNCPPNRGRA